MTLYASRAAADVAAERLKTYAQPQRLMILSRLLQGEQSVSEIEAATGIVQPALSQQLAELRRAEIVKTRRESKLVHYRLADEKVQHCVRSIEAMFGSAADASFEPQRSNAAESPRLAAVTANGAATFARLA